MFKRAKNTLRSMRPVRLGRLAAAATWLALLTPFAAVAGLSIIPAGETPGKQATAQREKAPPGLYQVRCWQFGKLLFEENRIAFPDGTQYSVRIGGKDRNNRPIYIAETENATCLIRSAAEERTAWPR